MKSFLAEIRRRNVARVAVLYLVAGWLILQVADVLFGLLQVPGWSLRLVLGLLMLGFPLALIFSWIYELTPEGIKREKDIDRSRSITPRTGHKINVLTLALASLAIAVVIIDRLVPESTTAIDRGAVQAGRDPSDLAAEKFANPGSASVAVLPFANMSGDPANDYFSDGISEEILNVLVKLDDLRVPSRTSSFAFKGDNRDIRDIARQLEVNHIVEGSVRRSGERVRITAQLIDVRTDSHLWSETFDRQMADIFAIQDEISREIVDALKIELGAEEEAKALGVTPPTDNVRAYELYLEGRYYWQQRGEENIRKSIRLLGEAVAEDPQFAKAYAVLAAAQYVLPDYTAGAVEPRLFTLRRTRASLDRALAIDSDLAEALAVEANVQTALLDWSGGLMTYEKAIEADPKDPTARLWYGIDLFNAGYLEEARVQLDVARRLDPAWGVVSGWLALHERLDGPPEAVRAFSDLAISQGWVWAFYSLLDLHLTREDYEGARDLLARFKDALDTGEMEVLSIMIDGLQRPDYRDQALNSILKSDAAFGEKVLPLRWLGAPPSDLLNATEMAHVIDDTTAVSSLWFPEARYATRGPEFGWFAERMGLLDLWRERGWPDLCRPAGDGIECD